MVDIETKINESVLMDLKSTEELIQKGHVLVLSADESMLEKLPKGKWIGGTIPYFYLKSENGRMDKEHIMVSDFTHILENHKIATYDESSLNTVCSQGYENGFNFMILPALQDIHLSFALEAPNYKNLFLNPLVGLIAGTEISESSHDKLAKTYNGYEGTAYTDKAVVMHAELPKEQVARLEIINVFTPSDEIEIEVEQDGFIVSDCFINGTKANLYEYIKQNDLNISYPIVSDYSGAIINVSFKQLDDEKKEVIFYAPLFKGRKYTTSKPFENYAQEFKERASKVMKNESYLIYNCNCILNYIYGELDKNSIGLSGATTFGEIAYNLVNQTFTYLAIDER